MPFFIIFIIIPFLELMIFAAVSDHIGIVTALGLAFLTAITGGAIVKHQGLNTIAQARSSMNRGTLPTTALFDGLCLVAAGALLITPGFLTDVVGFSLLIPSLRNALRHLIKTHTTWHAHTQNPQNRSHDDTIIDIEYEDITSETNNKT